MTALPVSATAVVELHDRLLASAGCSRGVAHAFVVGLPGEEVAICSAIHDGAWLPEPPGVAWPSC